jgi:eukaryotic-like serine/threonine-protein kinase
MTSNAGKLIKEWGKQDKRVETHLKRRKWIIFGIIGAIVLLIVYLVLNNLLGMVFRPITTLNSVPPTDTDWAMFGRNPLHSGGLAAASILPQGEVNSLLTAGAELDASPVVAGGTVYIGSRDHNLYAIDIASGAVRWKFEAGSWIESSPAVVNNVVYVGSNDGKLYALNAVSGKKLWDYSSRFVIRSSPAVADGIVYFSSNDYCIHALDAATGKMLWNVNTGTDVQSSPVVDAGILYTGTGGAYFFAVDARHGTVRNEFNAFRPVISSPIVKDGVVYFCNSEGWLYAMEGKSRNWLFENKIRPMWAVLYLYGGAPKPPPQSGFLWSLQLGMSSTSSPTIAGNNLYIGVDNKVVCVDLTNQSKRWEATMGGYISGTPLVAGNLVYATNENGHLYIFDSSSGEQIKDVAIGGTISSSPAISGSTVFVSSSDGHLYAVK